MPRPKCCKLLRLNLWKMHFHNLQSFQIFRTRGHDTILFIIANTINIMSAGGKEGVCRGITPNICTITQ